MKLVAFPNENGSYETAELERVSPVRLLFARFFFCIAAACAVGVVWGMLQ